MAMLALAYDWVPGRRPDGFVCEDAPEPGADLIIKTTHVRARGKVLHARPDSGGITVLTIEVDTSDTAAATIVAEDIQRDGAVEIMPVDDVPDVLRA